jgi:eukaryotic-like serine/threonine-protein kinase
MDAPASSGRRVRTGLFEIDFGSVEVHKEGRRIPLQEQPFRVLGVLLERPGEVITREELHGRLWPTDTFVGFDEGINTAIRKLRVAFGDSADNPRFIETLPRRGYRFIAPVQNAIADPGQLSKHTSGIPLDGRPDAQREKSDTDSARSTISGKAELASGSGKHWNLAIPIVLAVLALSIGSYSYLHRKVKLTETDKILVTDFVNTTGDTIFDGPLKQALTVKLAESPFFNIVPDSRVKETLALMGRSSDEHVLPPIAREVCQRAGGKVAVSGSIVAVGDRFMIGVRATNCLTGADIAHEEIEGQDRDHVLRSLGKIISPLRQKLGEAVSSIQKFDTPIEQATTKSLGALKAYTSGDQRRARGLDGQSVPFYKMAIDLDPDFAVAYARLGAVYGNLANSALADEYLTKAFERRQHVSEREKFYIAAHYYADSTRETDKAIETLRLWTETYSHDWVAYNNLSAEAVKVGQLDEATKAGQEALRLNPDNTFTYLSLSTAYIRASHFAEANAICEQAIKSKRESSDIHAALLNLAFVEGDESAIQRQLDWIQINAKLDSGFLNQEAWMAFALGEAGKGRDLFERSRAVSLQQGNDSPVNSKDYAAYSSANEAQLEVELGNILEAREKAELALKLMPRSLEVQSYTALVFAGLGDFRRAQGLTRELTNRFPSDTLLNNVTLPTVQAIIETKKKNYSEAIEALRRSTAYELGSHQDIPEGITFYHRGLAYLAKGSGEQAAEQFQKLLENRGIVAISPYWALAHLGLARADVLESRNSQTAEADAARVRALAAYKDFLTLWKNADPDIPILKEAKAEYAKLQ